MPVCPSSRSFHPALEAYLRSFGRKEPLDLALPHPSPDSGLTWSQLGYEIGLDCNGRTIQRAMGTMDYHKCLSCRRGWVNNKIAAHRVEWAQVMLNRYPKSEDWHKVLYDSAMKFITAGVPKASFESDTVRTVFRRPMNQTKRIKNVIIVGPQ